MLYKLSIPSLKALVLKGSRDNLAILATLEALHDNDYINAYGESPSEDLTYSSVRKLI